MMRTGLSVPISITLVLSALASGSLAMPPQFGIERVINTGASWDANHYDFQSSLVWSPDGEHIAATLWNGTVEIRFAANGTLERVIRTSADFTNSLCWSPDGGRLATAGSDGKIQVWNPINGTLLSDWSTNGKIVYSIAWSPDGGFIVSGSTNTSIQLWDVTTGIPINISAHSDTIMCVAWSPDGSLIATGSKDKEVWIWNTTSWTTIMKRPDNDWIRGVGWSRDGKLFAYSTDCQKLRILNMANLSIISTVYIQDGRSAFAWSPVDRCIAYGCWVVHGDEHLYFYDPILDSWNCETYVDLSSMVGIGWSPDGMRLATLSNNGYLRTWSKDSDRDGWADLTDFLPADPTQWTDTDGDGHGDNSSGTSGDALPFDPTQWQDSDNDGFGDNQSGNRPDPAPLDPDVPVRHNDKPWDWNSNTSFSPLIWRYYCTYFVVISGVIGLALFLYSRRGKTTGKGR